MNKAKSIKLVALGVLAAFSSVAQSELMFNGFASIGLGFTSGSDELHQGYDDKSSFKQDTLFALQARSNLGDGVSATAQIIAEGREDFAARFEWAYLSYELSDSNTLSVGKFRYPQYMYSDYLDVRYSYHWITPPNEVYTRFITSVDGVTLVNTSYVGSWDVTTQAWFGTASNFAVSDATVKSEYNNMTGVNSSWSKDWLTLRGVYVTGDLDYQLSSINGLAAGLAAAGYASVGDELKIEGTVSYAGLGFQADFGQYFVMGEFTTVEFETKNPAPSDTYYISAGYRMGDWTYHYTFSAKESTAASTDFIFNTVPDVPQLAPLRLGAAAVIGDGDDETSNTFGVRYDFHSAAALKLEYRMFEDSIDTFEDANLLRASVDLVF